MKKTVSKFLYSKRVISQVLFFFAFIDILAVDYVSATSIPVPFSGRMIQLAILLLGIVVLITHHSLKEWVGIVCLAILSLISFYYTRSYFACELSLLLIASKNMDQKQIIRVYLLFVGGLTIFVGAAAIFGIFGDVYQALDFRGNGIEVRYCMGYNHPNSYHIILIQLMLAFLWLYWKRIKWHHLIAIGIGNLIITFFTRSRTNMILGTLIIILLLIYKKNLRIVERKSIYLFNYLAIGFSMLLSILTITLGLKLNLLEIINRLWTERIRVAHEQSCFSEITLFSGEELQISCDMGFIKILYNYGIMILIFYLFLLGYFIYKNYKKMDYLEAICILTGVILILGEKFSSGEYITRNFIFVLMLGWGTYESNKPKKQSA